MANITEKELTLLFPETEVEIAGHTFLVTPFSFVETKMVAMKLQDVLHLFTGEITPNTLVQIYAQGFDGVRDVIAMTLGIKPALVEKFDQKSAMKAISKIIEVNKDFFYQQVENEVENLAETLDLDDNSNTEK